MKRALALSFILVVSVLAGGVALGSQPAQATPSGYTGVADGQVYSDLPSKTPMGQAAQEIANAGVMASSHADTLEVVVTSPGRAKNKIDGGEIHGSGPISIVLTDDQHSEGRTVALPADEIESVLGYQPKMVRGTHEDGTPWSEPIEVQDGWLLVDIPHFSTNTVTFAGEVQIGDTFTDGSTVNYDLNNLDAASDPTINLTGIINSEWDNKTATGIRDGETVSLDVADTGMDPAGPSLNGEPTITFTGRNVMSQHGVLEDEAGLESSNTQRGIIGDENTDVPYSGSIEIVPGSSGEVQNVTVNIDNVDGSDYNPTVDVYMSTGDADTTWQEGTLVHSGYNPEWAPGNQTVEFTTSYDVTAGNKYEIEFVTQSSDNDGVNDRLMLSLNYNATSVKYVEKRSSTFQRENWAQAYLNISLSTNSPSADIDGDGTAEASYSGALADGESVTKEIPSLSQSDDSATISTIGAVDVDVKLRERTPTQDPGVALNGAEWANHTGTLADGETVQYTLNSSTLNEGTNTIEVDTPELSADAPPMQVEVDYSHDAEDSQAVNYESEKFTERYNVSHQYADANTNPQLTIPFAGEVIQMRGLEYRTNGGVWQELTDYTIDNTTLTANLPDATAGDTHTVRANGSKVNVYNGEIKVTEPTPEGDRLDTAIDVPSRSAGDFKLSFQDGNRIHYAYDESYSEEEDYYQIQQDTDGLIMPQATQGASLRVSTIPIEAEPQTNDVAIGVEDPKTSEPTFNVYESNNPDDEVAFTYLNAQDGEDYVLYSQSRGVVHDSGTASSPLTLWDDDSEETLQFMIDNGSVSSTDGTGDDGPVVGPVTADASAIPLPSGDTLLIFGGIGLLVVGFLYWRGGTEAVASAGKTTAGAGTTVFGWLGGILRGFVTYLTRHPYAGGAVLGVGGLLAVGTGFISIPPQITTFLVITAVPIAAYYVLVRRLGASTLVWIGITIVTVVVGLQLLGTDIFELIFASEAGVIATIGTIGLVYYGLKTYRAEATTPDEQTNVKFELREGGD